MTLQIGRSKKSLSKPYLVMVDAIDDSFEEPVVVGLQVLVLHVLFDLLCIFLGAVGREVGGYPLRSGPAHQETNKTSSTASSFVVQKTVHPSK